MIQIKLLIGLVVLITGISIGFFWGNNYANTRWENKEKERMAQIEQFQISIRNMEAEANETAAKHEKILTQKETAYTKAINDIASSYNTRLQQSAKRSGIYKQQAEGSDTDRADLASYAAKLDRSLVEGKAVAGELRETVKFRDEQLKVLGQELLNTRKLLE